MRAERGQLRHVLAQKTKLADDRLEQMKTDRAQALRWKAENTELRDVLSACQRHLACSAVTGELVGLYGRVVEALKPNVVLTGLP